MPPSNTPSPKIAVTYTPESPIRRPVEFVSDCLRDLHASRELAWRLFIRNISARYRQTFLGFFWAVFPSLATTAIWVFLASQGVLTVDLPTGTSYLVFLLTGTMLWQTFAEAIQAPLRVISESKGMLNKINFPRESLPLAAMGEVAFSLAIRMIVLAGFFLYLGVSMPTTALLAPTGLVGLVLLGSLIGLALVPIGLLYQDVGQSLQLILQIWMYCTPVVFAPPQHGHAALMNWVNPVSPILNTTRDWILVGPSEYSFGCLVVTALSLLTLLGCFLFYRLAMPIVIERIGS